MGVNHGFRDDCPGEAKLGSHRLKKEQEVNPQQECSDHKLPEGSRRPLLRLTPGQSLQESSWMFTLPDPHPQRETLKAEKTQHNM